MFSDPFFEAGGKGGIWFVFIPSLIRRQKKFFLGKLKSCYSMIYSALTMHGEKLGQVLGQVYTLCSGISELIKCCYNEY